MPEFKDVKDSVLHVDRLLTALQCTYSTKEYFMVNWSDEAGFMQGYLLGSNGVVTSEVRHRHSSSSLGGVKMLSLEINPHTGVCSTYAKLAIAEQLSLSNFVKYISREIMALGKPVKSVG